MTPLETGAFAGPTPAEQLLPILLETLPCGVVHVGAGGAVLSANREALRILGLRFDELTKRYVVDFDTETLREDGSHFPADEYPVARVLATGKPDGPVTLGVRRPDGATSWAVFRAEPVRDSSGALAGAIVSFVDITERKQAEDALRESQLMWRTLAENHPDLVVICDREGRIVSINRTYPESDVADVIGRTVSGYLEPSFAKEWERDFHAILESRAPSSFETRAVGRNGAVVWWEVTVVPIGPSGAEARVERALCVGRDVTARRTMIANLAEKERLASVGMLSASVAHEIMNPLTSVLANLDFALSDRCPPGARMLAAVAEAREGAARMTQTVADLRALGRAGNEELLYIDVGAIMSTALRLSGADMKNVALSVELGPVPGVVASESRLCQVFINLLVNAAQAMTERPPGEREIRVRTRIDEGAGLVGVDVCDTGSGIPPEHLGRIFDPFFTTKRSGTGLGLSISKAHIERLGGRIDVVSTPGRGTTFTVWLSTERAARPEPVTGPR